MFLQELNEKEKRAFLSLGLLVMEMGNANIEESYMLYLVLEEMGLDIDERLNYKKKEELYKCFGEERAKKIAVLELLGLSYSEGILTNNIKEFIGEFAGNIGITKEFINNSEKWLIKQAELFSEVNNLLDK